MVQAYSITRQNDPKLPLILLAWFFGVGAIAAMNDSVVALAEPTPGLHDLAGLVSDRARAEFVEISSMLVWADHAEAELRTKHDGFLLQEEIAALPAIIGERCHLSRGQVSYRLSAAGRVRTVRC